MLKVARDFFQAQEIREALQLYRLELIVWPLVTWLAVFFTLGHGLPAGAALAGLVLLARLRPRLSRLPSPDRRRVLIDCRWSFGRVLFIAALVALSAAFRPLAGPPGPAACALWALFLPLAAAAGCFMFVLPPLLDRSLLCAFHLVLLLEDGRLQTWHARLCAAQVADTEYLWLPDSRTLLVAQSDEDDCWYLYLYDPALPGRAARYPFNLVIGRYPHLRHLTLGEARARIAPVLRQPLDAPLAQTYEDRCRRFYVWLNPQCVNQ